MLKGVVRFFDIKKGWGFIKPADGSQDIFVHVSDLKKTGLETLSEAQPVIFSTEQGRPGKGLKAVDVRLGG